MGKKRYPTKLISILTTSGLLGCKLLYQPFSGPNPNNCINDPSICAQGQTCDTETGLCAQDQSALVVTAVSPPAGINSMATPVTITGRNFHAGVTVTVAGDPCAAVTVVSATQLTCIVQPKPASCGKQDVVVKNSDGQTMGIGAKLFTYRSASPFGTRIPIPGSGPQVSVVTADFNSDGRLDLAGISSGGVTAWLGVGDGTFTPSGMVNPGGVPSAIAAADLNRDGKVDLVTANYMFPTVGVLLGNGAGGFAMAQTTSLSANPSEIVAADLNGDLNPDVMVVLPDSGAFILLLGDGLGGLRLAQSNGFSGVRPRYLSVGDFDGDQQGDLLVTLGDGPNILKNLGGGFGANTTLGLGTFQGGTAAFDIDSDKKLDVFFIDPTNQMAGYVLGNGDLTFGTGQLASTGPSPSLIRLGDVDGDGMTDFLVTYMSDSHVDLYYGNADLTLMPRQSIQIGSVPYDVALGDWNKDGRLDLAVVQPLDTTVGIYLGQCK